VTGKNKTITMAKIPKGYDIKVTFNSNGVPSMSEIFNEMVTIAKKDNLIKNNNDGIKPVKLVGDLLELEEKQAIAEDETHGKEIS
jgi:hypothetical protein